MVSIQDIREAQSILQGVSIVTPLDHSRTLSELSHNDVYLKLENLQRTGSFKIRGAYNRLSHLPGDMRSRGVIAASAGNHAQGVAEAARLLNMPCTIVMPAAASFSKVQATRGYGAKVVLFGDSYDDAFIRATQLRDDEGSVLIHAFDDEQVIAGQGTIGLELLDSLPDIDAVLVPVGGGGLLAGIATAVKSIRPGVRVFGVQASGAASFRASFEQHSLRALEHVATIADGIAVKRPGNITWDIGSRLAEDVLVVEEEEIARAMVFLLERMKVLSEGAGATGVAALLSGRFPLTDKRVAVILSGGNVDMSLLSRLIEHGLAAAGRRARIVTILVDRPGALSRLLRTVAECGANISSVEHHRFTRSLVIGQVEVQLEVETRDTEHLAYLCDQFSQAGYTFEID